MGFVGNYIANLAAVTLGKQPQRPLLFSYYITHRCSLNCGYCCDGDGKRFKEDTVPELSTDEACRLLEILRKAGDTVDITGGEPMERGDLETVLAHAKKVGLRTVLNTKGIGLPDRPDILKHADTLVVSVDSLAPAVLAQQIGRCEATGSRILEALDFAMTKHQDQLVLSSVATPATIGGLGDVLKFAMDNDLGFHVSPEIVGREVNPELRESDAYKLFIEACRKAKTAGGHVLGIDQYLRGIRDFSSFSCHPMLMPVIRPSGHLYYPCLEHKRADVNVLVEGDYHKALKKSRAIHGEIPNCDECCHIFCHMALSLLQRHPISALKEMHHV